MRSGHSRKGGWGWGTILRKIMKTPSILAEDTGARNTLEMARELAWAMQTSCAAQASTLCDASNHPQRQTHTAEKWPKRAAGLVECLQYVLLVWTCMMGPTAVCMLELSHDDSDPAANVAFSFNEACVRAVAWILIRLVCSNKSQTCAKLDFWDTTTSLLSSHLVPGKLPERRMSHLCCNRMVEK